MTYYAGSVAGSIALDGGLGLHASGGVLGISATIFGETVPEQFGVLAAGGDFRVTPELRLAGEFRRVGIEDGTNIVTAGVRFPGTGIGGEAGWPTTWMTRRRAPLPEPNLRESTGGNRYTRSRKSNGRCWIRTSDLLLVRQALSTN